MNKENLSPGLTAYRAESMTSDAPAPTNNDMIARNIKKHHLSFICNNKKNQQKKTYNLSDIRFKLQKNRILFLHSEW